MTAEEYLAHHSARTQDWLAGSYPREDEPPESLHRAMRYSLFAGGKRLRPALALAAGEIARATTTRSMPVACALELIHTYSLVHDDLPAMDDDDLRRGRPTCHKVFGEATAILAGDALLTLRVPRARRARQRRPGAPRPCDRRDRRAAGSPSGMVGGQVLDLDAEGKPRRRGRPRPVHSGEDGRADPGIRRLGRDRGRSRRRRRRAAPALRRRHRARLPDRRRLLDVTASAADLGKTPGKDSAAAKATFPALYGLDASRARARALADEAVEALDGFGAEAEPLRMMACFVVERRK